MPAATSPYVQNDYQAVSNFRPHRLSVNEVFRAISAQNQFWDQGAMRIKSVYDNALNLKLTNPENRKIRDEFMKNSEKEINKLSSMDVSDPSVQREGFNVFKPLFQDEGIMYDDQMTRHYENVRNSAESFKNKDNGEGYSDINFQYSMEGYDDFINSTDRMIGKNLYSKKKDYIPYYNYTPEINTILKNCKGDSSSGEFTNGMYISTQSIEERSTSKTYGCLQSSLSPKALQQMRITGSVQYGKNYEALSDDYIRSSLSDIEGLQAQSAAYSGRLASPSITPEEKKTLTQQRDLVDTEINKLQETNKRIASGDLDYIKNNYDILAGSIYSRNKLGDLSKSFSYRNEKNEKKADPVQMLITKLSNDNQQKEIDRKFDAEQEQNRQKFEMTKEGQKQIFEMQKLNAQLKSEGKSGSYKLDDNGQIQFDENDVNITTQTGDDVIRTSKSEFDKEFNENKSALSRLDQNFLNEMKTISPELKDISDVSDNRFISFLDEYSKTPEGKIDRRIQQWKKTRSDLNLSIKASEIINNSVEEKFKSQNKQDYQELLNDIEIFRNEPRYIIKKGDPILPSGGNIGIPFTLEDGKKMNLTRSDFADLLLGKPIIQNGHTITKIIGAGAIGNTGGFDLEIDGKHIKVKNYTEFGFSSKTADDIKNILNKGSKLLKSRDKFYQDELVSVRKTMSLGNQNNKDNPLRNQVYANIKNLDDDIKLDDIQLNYTNGERTIVSLPKGISSSKVKKALEMYKPEEVPNQTGQYYLYNVPQYSFLKGSSLQDKISLISNGISRKNLNPDGSYKPFKQMITMSGDRQVFLKNNLTGTGTEYEVYDPVTKRSQTFENLSLLLSSIR